MVVLPSENGVRNVPDHSTRLWAAAPLTESETAAPRCAERVARTSSRFHVFTFLVLLLALFFPGCSPATKSVVVYTSQDQVYAEPILKRFTERTGVKVLPVFDSEAVKTVGLVNRLLAERHRPQCDVFWNNEALRTHQLALQRVFRESDPWRAVGYRSRRMVINTKHVSASAAPKSLSELTNSAWRAKVALAYPLFGTTATHFLVLRQHWGASAWEAWCRALVANEARVVDGNSVVVKLVGRGEAWIGLTDSDDIAAAKREGLPVDALPLSEESLLIPNTIGVMRDAPHPDEAQQLFDYLQSTEVLQELVTMNALEGASLDGVGTETLRPDYPALLRDLEAATGKLKEIFLR